MPRKQGSGSSLQTKRNYNARHNKAQAQQCLTKQGMDPPSFAPQIKGASHSKKQNHRKMINAANAAFISLF